MKIAKLSSTQSSTSQSQSASNANKKNDKKKALKRLWIKYKFVNNNIFWDITFF